MNKPTDFYAHDLDVADNFASKAIDRLRNDEIPPVPQNFELWYVYYANVNPKLRDEVNALLLDQPQLMERDCHDLYEKFLNGGHERETYQKAGDQISATLQDVSGVVENVKNTTSQFTGSLKETTDRLADAKDPDDVQAAIEAIVAETQRMVAFNEELSNRLDKSYALMHDLKRDMERIRREAVTDGLTGLANRKAFDEQIGRICRECKKDGGSFSLLMIDIDHFKTFNDTYGHQIGDQVLRLVSMTLVNEVKGQDMVARYGGEEFVVILPGTNANAAKIVANNLRQAVEKKEVINRVSGDNLGQITVSIGAAQFYEDESADELIGRADRALYDSKNKGRNQVTVAASPYEDRQ